MKLSPLFAVAVLSSIVSFARADLELTISGVHNCCESCTKQIEKIINGTGNKFMKAGNGGIIVQAKGKTEGKKIIEALMDGGFYGKTEAASASASSSASSDTKKSTKPAKMVKSAKISGVHLCCQRCATTLAGAMRAIPGVKTHNIYPRKEEFVIEGEFDKEAVLPAMNEAGFHGKVR